MQKLDNNALKSALEIISGLQNIEKEYGRETLITVLDSVGGFFGLVGVINPENVDKQELESYITKNRPQKEKSNEVPKTGPYESDELDKFGIYKELVKREENHTKPIEDMSIYSQDPQILSKVAEDKQNHLQSNNNTLSNERKQTYNAEESSPYMEEEQDYKTSDNDISIEELSAETINTKDNQLTKVLRPNNPWASAGEPVSPGEINFEN